MKDIYSILTENADGIKNTEIALAVEAITDQLDSMVQKLSSLYIKDLALVVKKLKFDNNIDQADALAKNIGGKLQEATQTIASLKSDLETEVVNLMNGNVSSAPTEENDFSSEFNPEEDNEESEESDEEAEDDENEKENIKGQGNFDDIGEMERTFKK